MKILFFDMEFANGKIPGSIYSFGYVQTNGKLALTQPQTDILMNPECRFNDYVRKNILAYPMNTVKEASTFPAYYRRLKKLLCRADLAVGFAVGNDTSALLRDCERYHLKPLVFKCLDLERLCKKFSDHKDARGLSGCVEAWCGTIPEHQHRSDGDAYATMLLFRAICEAKSISPKNAVKQFADCMIPSIPPVPKKSEKDGQSEDGAEKRAESSKAKSGNVSPLSNGEHRKRRRRRRRLGNRPIASASNATVPNRQGSDGNAETVPADTAASTDQRNTPSAS